jgi:hypothetical protein
LLNGCCSAVHTDVTYGLGRAKGQKDISVSDNLPKNDDGRSLMYTRQVRLTLSTTSASVGSSLTDIGKVWSRWIETCNSSYSNVILRLSDCSGISRSMRSKITRIMTLLTSMKKMYLRHVVEVFELLTYGQ